MPRWDSALVVGRAYPYGNAGAALPPSKIRKFVGRVVRWNRGGYPQGVYSHYRGIVPVDGQGTPESVLQ